MKNIAKAIIEVMKAVKGMEKNSRVGSGRSAYDGTKYKDVAEVFNDALENNGLCILPISIDEETQVDRWEEPDPYSKPTTGLPKMKQSVFSKVKTKYMLLHDVVPILPPRSPARYFATSERKMREAPPTLTL